MKFIHTSDLHLASSLSSRLPADKAQKRRRELDDSFSRICAYAADFGAEAVIIAGDLFDTEKITKKGADAFLSTVRRYSDIKFLYVSGNHEGDVLKNVDDLPNNLLLYSDGWSCYTIGDVHFYGRCDVKAGIFDDLILDNTQRNVIILHAQLREYTGAEDIVALKDMCCKGIDYLALGHYHSYSSVKIDQRGIAVYSGTPEGRGFDEAGECGFVLVDTQQAQLSVKFVPSAQRRLIIKEVDIGDSITGYDAQMRIQSAIEDERACDLIRINLIGKRNGESCWDTELLRSAFSHKYFYFEIKDRTKLITDHKAYEFDKSLKGEFIRLCLADESLTEEEKESVIAYGLSALAGERLD